MQKKKEEEEVVAAAAEMRNVLFFRLPFLLFVSGAEAKRAKEDKFGGKTITMTKCIFGY